MLVWVNPESIKLLAVKVLDFHLLRFPFLFEHINFVKHLNNKIKSSNIKVNFKLDLT